MANTIPSAPLNILTFPQRWNHLTRELSLHILILPKGDPLTGFSPAFPDATLALSAHFIPSLQQLPTSVPAGPALVITQDPAERRAFFDELLRVLHLTPNFRILPSSNPGPAPSAVKKFLTSSYREASRFTARRTRFAVTDASYECALRDDPSAPSSGGPKPEFYWPEILSFVLRQPELAIKLGLIYRTSVTLPAPNPFAQGGYLYADLGEHSDYAAVPRQLFAARIPSLPLQKDRTVFASVLFPVDLAGNFDQVFPEADLYDDGFAKLVHGSQPPRAAHLETSTSSLPAVKDVGIRLAWDDEQVAIWLNRQLGLNAVDPSLPPPPSPLGVAGYRVDVFDQAANQWQSLLNVTAPQLTLGTLAIGPFNGELSVEVIPANPNNRADGEFWLPSYFTAWAGASLAIADPNPFAIAGHLEHLGTQVYSPVGADRVALRYGNTYGFRVRLMDATGGGPDASSEPSNPAPESVTSIPFRRFVPPKAVKITASPALPIQRTAHFEIARPELAYPDVVFTGKYTDPMTLLLAQTVAAQAAEKEPALPDPDVTQLRVDVQVRTLCGDPSATTDMSQPFAPLYSTVRHFPPELDRTLALDLEFQDLANLQSLAGATIPDGTPLPLPTARDIRLVFTPLGADDPQLHYWGTQEARIGAAPVQSYLRATSHDEQALFVPSLRPEIQAIFLQPDLISTTNLRGQMDIAGLRHEAPSDLVSLLAHHLDLPHTDLTFGSTTGHRVVYGCSTALRHIINPDGSSITFGSKTDLTRHWIIAFKLTLNRDWTWDALTPVAFVLQRQVDRGAISKVATVSLPRIINPVAAQDPDHNHTDLVIFDAFDPKPAPGVPLTEPLLLYSLVPQFSAGGTQADPSPSWELTLPITTPPGQVPRVVSAGLAASDYRRDERYTTTEERHRLLYLELDRPPLDAHDAYFARVLAYGPDPMLIGPNAQIPSDPEPPLPIDPEPIRVIVPNQSNDGAGLTAMQQLTPSPYSPRHYLLPLPPGLNPDSSELFGFFVYELRVGHDGTRWSTAQGRFGHPLRVNGVQHPAPQLRCSVMRNVKGVSVNAPFAAAVWQGRNLRLFDPRSQLYALLYAQVLQADGQAWRNVLLLHARARIDVPNPDLPHPNAPGLMEFSQEDILRRLTILGLPADASLSVLAVETLPEPHSPFPNPVGDDLGQVRFLRTSTLAAVPAICPPEQAI
jgi:hypothetical protein